MATTIDYNHNNHGTLNIDGTIIELTEGAEPTSRLLEEPQQSLGLCEWSAQGTRNGSPVRVYWLHKDDGREAADYDWDNVARIEEA